MKWITRLMARGVLWFWLYALVLSGARGATTNSTTMALDNARETVSTTVSRGASSELSFGLDRIPQFRFQVLGIPIWEYLAFIIYIILALLVARLLDYLVTVELKKITARTRTKVDDLLVQLLHGPLKVLVVIGMLWFGLDVFHWPPFLEQWLKNGFKVVLGCSLTYLAMKMVDLAAGYWKMRPSIRGDRSFNELLIPLISKSVKIFIFIMAVLTTLDSMNFNIRTLLAGVSISGLALGLAAQDTVGNLFGAAAVFVDKPFAIGDRIQLNGVDGTVEQMGLRSTRIRNLDGYLITVPNKTMGNATITNVTRRPNIKTVLNFGLTYETSAEKIQQAVGILDRIYKGNPMTADLIIGFNQFGDSALNINVVHWWKDQDGRAYTAGMQEMNLAIKKEFDQQGIAFAFPSRTVYLRQDNEWRLQLPENTAPGANA